MRVSKYSGGSMKAIVMEDWGSPEVLLYKEMPIPSIKADEILVRVHSAGVSPFDLHVRDGWYKESYPLPIILGWDLSGIVVAVGAEISKFKEGSPVFAHSSVYRNGGSYAMYTALKENEAALKPASISYNQAASVSMNGLTAWQALFDVAHLSAGQKILVHAAAGGIGHLAVQLAKWKGAHVIGTASAKNKEFLRSLGVDEVIDYTTTPFEKVVKHVDVDFERIKQAADFGVKGEGLVVAPNSHQLSEIGKLLSEGKITVHIGATFPLKDAANAHRLIQSGHTRGKVILEVEA
jgi:NADPH:quinone reductase-like Zn-dependent oxidoreductase